MSQGASPPWKGGPAGSQEYSTWSASMSLEWTEDGGDGLFGSSDGDAGCELVTPKVKWLGVGD